MLSSLTSLIKFKIKFQPIHFKFLNCVEILFLQLSIRPINQHVGRVLSSSLAADARVCNTQSVVNSINMCGDIFITEHEDWIQLTSVSSVCHSLHFSELLWWKLAWIISLCRNAAQLKVFSAHTQNKKVEWAMKEHF